MKSDPALDPSAAYPLNELYGKGAYRRRVRLRRQGSTVLAMVDDSYHAMWCRIRHDGVHVSDVEAGFVRVPTTTCFSAWLPLRELIGMRLDTDRRELYGSGRPRRNCTHQFDAAALAMAQALRASPDRVYDVVIPDETTDAGSADVFCDGALVLRWLIRGTYIVDAAGNRIAPLLNGFAAWAVEHLAGDRLEAAMVLQRGYFVSRGRKVRVDAPLGLTNRGQPAMFGACHSYIEPQLAIGVKLTTHVRDFSDELIEEPEPAPLR